MFPLHFSEKDRLELEDLIARHPNRVILGGSTREDAHCRILVEDGAIYWLFTVRQGEWTMIKTRLDENALTFQEHDVFRLAWLTCKQAIHSIREAHRARNEFKALHPSPGMRKKTRERDNRMRQGTLTGLEVHTQRKPPKGWYQ